MDKSLVIADSQGDETRYRMLETIREYARAKLIESGEAMALRARHRDWFLRLVEETEPKLRSVEQPLWLNRLETEYENLRAALGWSLWRQNADEGDTQCGLSLAGALWQFWLIRGHLKEGRAWLAEALQKSTDSPTGAAPKEMWHDPHEQKHSVGRECSPVFTASYGTPQHCVRKA